MKILFCISLFALTFTTAQAACLKKIDNSKVIMFVDTNESNLEIETAQKAACDRGQRLVIIPKNYKEFGIVNDKTLAAKKGLDTCEKKNGKNSDKCKSQLEKFTTAYYERENYKYHQPEIKAQIKEALDGVRKDKATVENFTISGHDGGGHFGGLKSQIGRQEVFDLFSGYEDINKVKSIFLLGCYTGVPREAMEWMSAFPELRIVGGYDGSAPLAFRPEGHEYLYDLMMQEKPLVTTGEQNKLKAIINKNFKSIKLLNASMYLKPACQTIPEEKSYYYGSILEDFKGLNEFDPKECEKIQPQIKALRERLTKYFTGEMEPPTDTVKGEMREIYSKSRRFEHCFPEGSVGATAAFGLLFQDGLKSNFTTYYKNELAQVENIIKNTTQDDLDKAHDEIMSKVTDAEERLDAQLKDFQNYLDKPDEYVMAKYNGVVAEQEAYFKELENPKYKSFLERFPGFDIRKSSGGVEDLPTNAEDIKIYNTLAAKLKPLIEHVKDYTALNKDPYGYADKKQAQLDSDKQYIARFKSTTESTKLKVDDLKNILIPTKEKLEGKSRKEILQSLYDINGTLANVNLPDKLRRALTWSHDVSVRHMYQYNIPFSWHEASSNPEAPEYAPKLEDCLKNESINLDRGILQVI